MKPILLQRALWRLSVDNPFTDNIHIDPQSFALQGKFVHRCDRELAERTFGRLGDFGSGCGHGNNPPPGNNRGIELFCPDAIREHLNPIRGIEHTKRHIIYLVENDVDIQEALGLARGTSEKTWVSGYKSDNQS